LVVAYDLVLVEEFDLVQMLVVVYDQALVAAS
jgi:hypothetical protein